MKELKNQKITKEELDKIYIYSNVKKKIIPQLINNKDTDNNKLKVKFNDELDIIFRIMIIKKDDVISVIVTNELFDYWKINQDQIYKDALDNLKKIIHVEDLLSLIKNRLKINQKDYKEVINNIDTNNRIHLCLTNTLKLFGASVILDNELMKTLYNRVGEFIIIPSSIHEVIIIKKEKEYEEFREMVKEINQRELEEKDILANDIFTWKDNKVVKL